MSQNPATPGIEKPLQHQDSHTRRRPRRGLHNQTVRLLVLFSLALAFILPSTPVAAAPAGAAQQVVAPQPPCVETMAGFSQWMSHYNLITRDNFSTSSDVEGRAFIGGTIGSSGYTQGNQLPAGFPATDVSLEIAGTIGSGGTVNVIRGSARVGSSNSVAFTSPNNQYTVNGVRLFDMSQGNSGANVAVDAGLAAKKNQIADDLLNASQYLAGLPSNNTVNIPASLGPLTLQVNTVDANGVAIFNVSAAQLVGPTVQSIQINNTANADTILINVSGTSVNWPGSTNLLGSWLNDTSANGGRARTLWNFHEATSISMTVNFKGALLAPKAAVNGGSQNFDGAVAVKSLTNPGEVHLPVFVGDLTKVCPDTDPEPGTGQLILSKIDGENQPVAGWEMCVYEVAGGNSLGDLVECLETNAQGNAVFANLPVGDYFACEVLESGWSLVDPASPDLETTAGGNDLACMLVTIEAGEGSPGPNKVMLKDTNTNQDAHDVRFIGVSNKTWTYEVEGIGNARGLSNWVLGFGNCIDYIPTPVASSASFTPYNGSPIILQEGTHYELTFGTDPHSGITGIKFDDLVDKIGQVELKGGVWTFSLTFEEDFQIDTVKTGKKASTSAANGPIAGPGCGGPESVSFKFKNLRDLVELEVEKTADTAYTEETTWEIVKSVDPAGLALFAGDEADADYTVQVNPETSTSGYIVSGQITIHNPDSDRSAIITGIVDQLSANNEALALAVTVTCPDDIAPSSENPFTLLPGATLTCDYSVPAQNAAFADLNTVNVTVSDDSLVLGNSATAIVDWSAASITAIGDTAITVDDAVIVNDGDAELYTDGQFDADFDFNVEGDLSVDYSHTYYCPADLSLYDNDGFYSYTVVNTATIRDSSPAQSDSTTVTVDCYIPVVAKTATPSFDRTWEWDIHKAVDQSLFVLEQGESATPNYTVTITRTGSVDSNWGVSGQITVRNPHPTAPFTFTALDDILGTGQTLPVQCPTNTVLADDSIVCTYEGAVSSGQNTINTAVLTATNGITFTSNSPLVVFGEQFANQIRATVNVTDSNLPGESEAFSNSGTWEYPLPQLCGDDLTYIDGQATRIIDNIARISETGQQSEQSITIICNQPEVILDIEIEKATNGVDADEPTGPFIAVGGQVVWTYVITNNSNVDLIDVVVVDDNGTPNDPQDSFIPCTFSTLAVGESQTCSWTSTAQAGQYGNIAVVTGSYNGQTVSDEDPSHYFGAAPDIDILKLTNGLDANSPQTAVQLTAGDAIVWTYIVTNTGNVPLSNVTVTDDQGVVVNCPETELDVTESMTCTGEGTAESESYVNIGTATGTFNEETVTAEDPSHYVSQPVPTPLGSIGDTVWEDLNNNGQQDAGEPGVPGVTVNLFVPGNDTPIRTTITDGAGNYLFEELPAGEYIVQFVLPEGFEFTEFQAPGVPATLNSDANPADGGRTPVIDLAPGQNDLTWDAGLVTEVVGAELGSIGDTVWEDLNNNGQQDDGEPGVPGVTVHLFVPDSDTPFRTTTTDGAGNYLFDELPAGEYIVQFVLPEGFEFTDFQTPGVPATLNSDANPADGGRTPVINLAPGQNDLTWDAGLVTEVVGAELASLGDYVWLDTNRDGIQDADEPGVAGVEVQLYEVINGVAGFTGKTQTTDATGFYLFEDLEPGQYYVEFVLPEGYSFTEPNVGTNDQINSKAIVPTLGVEVDTEATEVQTGGTILYTIDYTNSGSRPAEGVSLTFTVPQHMSIVLENNPGWSCTESTADGICTYNIGTVNPGSGDAMVELTVNEQVPNAPGVVIDLQVEIWQQTNGMSFVTPLDEGESDLRHDAGLVVQTPSSGDTTPITIVLSPTNLPPASQQPDTVPLGPASIYIPSVFHGN